MKWAVTTCSRVVFKLENKNYFTAWTLIIQLTINNSIIGQIGQNYVYWQQYIANFFDYQILTDKLIIKLKQNE